MEFVLEIEILPNSSVVGKTIGEIQKKYGIRVIHIHKGIPEDIIRKNPSLDKKIEPGQYVKVTGPYKKVSHFFVRASRRNRATA